MNVYKVHELRMWTVQIIIPAVLVGIYLWNETDAFANTKRKLRERKLHKEAKKKAKKA